MSFAMHIAEGFLPPVWAALWTVVAAPFVVLGFRSLKQRLDARPEDKLVVASAGAFAFVLSALKIPSVNGSCSHPTGVGLGAVLFGPAPMAALGTIVLVFQSLLLAHGGLTTLGANVVSMAVVGPWVSWLVYRAFVGRLGFSWAGGLGAGVGSLSTYGVTALQLALAHPDPSSGLGGSLIKFLGIFAVTQVPLSIIEGIVTLLALRWLSARSTINIPAITGQARERALPARWVIATLCATVLLVVAPLVAQRGAEWAGADARATDEVTAIDPGYEQWFDGWWSPPSGEVESFLFALQAAVGAAVIGYVFGSRRRRSNDPPETSTQTSVF
jgi:cobalt/nickel transport system permease protein